LLLPRGAQGHRAHPRAAQRGPHRGAHGPGPGGLRQSGPGAGRDLRGAFGKGSPPITLSGAWTIPTIPGLSTFAGLFAHTPMAALRKGPFHLTNTLTRRKEE